MSLKREGDVVEEGARCRWGGIVTSLRREMKLRKEMNDVEGRWRKRKWEGNPKYSRLSCSRVNNPARNPHSAFAHRKEHRQELRHPWKGVGAKKYFSSRPLSRLCALVYDAAALEKEDINRYKCR